MKTTIQTGLYRLHDPTMDWGAAHLYEHLLIQSFRDYVAANGYSPHLYGWVGGETFEGMLFIEYGFYSSTIEVLFAQFMQQSPRVNLDMLDAEILRIEAEDKVLIEINDMERLKLLLKSIDNTKFVDVEAGGGIEQVKDIQSQQSVLKERRSKKSFRHVTVAAGLPSTNLEEKAIFTRLTPIIFDALNKGLFSAGLYENEVSWPVYNKPHDAMLAHAIYTVKNDIVTNDELKALAQKALAAIRLEGHETELRHYIDGFAATPNWHTFPIDYFRHTGLIVSRADIARLFTVENVESVLGKLKVEILATVQEHFDVTK